MNFTLHKMSDKNNKRNKQDWIELNWRLELEYYCYCCVAFNDAPSFYFGFLFCNNIVLYETAECIFVNEWNNLSKMVSNENNWFYDLDPVKNNYETFWCCLVESPIIFRSWFLKMQIISIFSQLWYGNVCSLKTHDIHTKCCLYKKVINFLSQKCF